MGKLTQLVFLLPKGSIAKKTRVIMRTPTERNRYDNSSTEVSRSLPANEIISDEQEGFETNNEDQ